MPLMGYLLRLGATAMPAGPEASALVAQYRRYLASERALTEAVADKYARLVGEFLQACGQPDGPGLEELSAAWVTSYVPAQCRGRPPGSAKFVVTTLRPLLRFLFQVGHVRREVKFPPSGVPGVCRAAGVVVGLLASCPGGGPPPEELRAAAAVQSLPGEPCAAVSVRAGLAGGCGRDRRRDDRRREACCGVLSSGRCGGP
jgi:hypothetical protein